MSAGVDLAGEVPPQQKKPKKDRKASSYDQPTEEKKRLGARLREAREVAGLTLTEAAEKLGYSQPVQLSLMENGNRPVTLRVVIQLAGLYGTTTDFLCGLNEDADRDPVVAVQRHAAALVSAQIRRLTEEMARISAEAVQQLMPSLGDGQRMAALVIESHRALQAIRTLNASFDTKMRGGSQLIAKLQLANEAAVRYVDQVERGRRALQLRTMRADAHRLDGELAQTSLLPMLDAPATGG